MVLLEVKPPEFSFSLLMSLLLKLCWVFPEPLYQVSTLVQEY
jgi:hypothetical protein